MEYIEAFEEFEEEEEEACTCNKCGAKYYNSTVKGYCQDCIDASDEAQDEKDNSSCYSVSY